MKNRDILIILCSFLFLMFFWEAKYTINETQQVIITQFGEPKGEPIRKPGLYFKLPFIQKVNYFDKRILQWDGDPKQIPTLDKRYIWVDTTARWKITDPLKFMQSVGSERGAHAQLDAIIEGATREAISSVVLVEAIRNSNRLNQLLKEEKDAQEITDFEIQKDYLENIKMGRGELTKDIINRSSKIVSDYGIELVDVLIKRINYVEDVRRKVYERMISERNRAAEKFRSQGQGKRAEIEGQMLKELKEIRSKAYKQAQELKGHADAEAIKIYAEAYNKDPEFYSFLKTLEAYKETIKSDSTLILSTESDFFKYLKTINNQEFSQ